MIEAINDRVEIFLDLVDRIVAGDPGATDIALNEAKPSRTKSFFPVSSSNMLTCKLSISGWGEGLEKRSSRLTTLFDPDLPADQSARDAVQRLSSYFKKQALLAAIAKEAGIGKPLETKEELRSTAHLLVDRAAIRTLVDVQGGPHAARVWIDRQMELHAEQQEDVMGMPNDVLIQIEGAVMVIPFCLKPLVASRGSSPHNPGAPVWGDDHIFLSDSIPETTKASLVGRPVADLLSSSPIQDRRIISIAAYDDFGIGGGNVVVETDRAPIDSLLPRCPS